MSWFHRSTARFEELDPPQVSAELAAGGGVLVDVREPHEWAAGHASGAVHMPLGRLAARAGELPPDRPIYVICAHGNRSKVGVQLLQRAGVVRAVNVRGGTAAWMRAGLPMARG